jgi:hypothetical protein
MSAKQIHSPAEFLADLGSLHDVEVNSLEFDQLDQTLVLKTPDINANFTETPEYKGCRPCALIFQGVRALTLDVETHEAIRISRATVIRSEAALRLEVDLNLGGGALTGGRRSIAVAFDSLHLKDLPLKE